MDRFDIEQIEGSQQGRMRYGSPLFYELLREAAETHDKKSHDYASDGNPFANYYFAGEMSKLFNDARDAGFVGRLAEKMYRLANLDNRSLVPNNESVLDTEGDIAVIVLLWMASRRDRRMKNEQERAAKTQHLGNIGPEFAGRHQGAYREGRTVLGRETDVRGDKER